MTIICTCAFEFNVLASSIGEGSWKRRYCQACANGLAPPPRPVTGDRAKAGSRKSHPRTSPQYQPQPTAAVSEGS